MLRPVHLILLVSMMVLVSCLEEPLKPTTMEVESPLQNANDLNADATAYGYGNPWRYGSYGLGVVAETVGTVIAGDGEDGQAEAVGGDTNTRSLRYY